jgi:2Fe-2S ferredoxin
MARVTYIDVAGASRAIDVPAGDTVMQGAVQNGVDGIAAECGGGLACATCHCYVDEAWIETVGVASGAESDMLEATASERKPNSRLSCQITMGPALDGLVVHLPPSQY